jgi:hypothetical protein
LRLYRPAIHNADLDRAEVTAPQRSSGFDSDTLSEAERKQYAHKALAGIRYATSSHLTGTRKCTDGKPWGGSWQSALWTGTLGFAAWLLSDEVDADLRQGVERIVASEAVRFLAGKPPAGNFNDTKAEENGWNLTCISKWIGSCTAFRTSIFMPRWRPTRKIRSQPAWRSSRCNTRETVFDWVHPRPHVTVPGSWANIDGRLGVVAAAGAGLTYVRAAGYQPGLAVCADVFYGSFSDHPKSFKAGEEVVRRIAIFYVEVTPQETSALAQSARIETRPQGEVLHFKLAGGGEGLLPLIRSLP